MMGASGHVNNVVFLDLEDDHVSVHFVLIEFYFVHFSSCLLYFEVK